MHPNGLREQLNAAIDLIERGILNVLLADGVICIHDGATYLAATPKVILDTAVRLIQSAGNTTTLDVKQCLRTCNYWVTQSDVSHALDMAQQLGLLSFVDNGTYRVYSLPITAQSTGTDNDWPE